MTEIGDALRGLKCPACDYDLTGLREHRCPECGAEFDAADLRSEFAGERAAQWRNSLGILAITLVVLTLQCVAITIYFLNGMPGEIYPASVPAYLVLVSVWMAPIVQLSVAIFAVQEYLGAKASGARRARRRYIIAAISAATGVCIWILCFTLILNR